MPRNPPSPPKPKLHGLGPEDFKEWYRELDAWHTELEAISRRNNVRMNIQRRKNLELTKNPKAVARMERARTMAPKKGR